MLIVAIDDPQLATEKGHAAGGIEDPAACDDPAVVKRHGVIELADLNVARFRWT